MSGSLYPVDNSFYYALCDRELKVFLGFSMSFDNSQFLLSPIEYLKGVGPQRGEWLRKELGIATFRDMLFYFPFRYEDKSSLKKIGEISSEENILLKGRFTDYEVIGVGKRKRLVARFSDGTGTIDVTWFSGISWIEKRINRHDIFSVYGKVTFFKRYPGMNHPELENLNEEKSIPNTLFPIYPSTEKLRSKNLSGRNYTKLVWQLLQSMDLRELKEFLPESILHQHNLPRRAEAIQWIHFPQNELERQRAHFRLAYEEFFLHQMNIGKMKRRRKKNRGVVFKKVGDLFNGFYHHALKFELTGDQKKVIKEIYADTRSGFQMNRLLQGDVGSGKTIVALLSMLLALDNGFQACLVAPTEILAQQHFQSVKRLLEGMDIESALLTGSIKGKERKRIFEGLEEGRIRIIIGTHALFEKNVRFRNLGICIIDEQHRFGVEQRAKMWQKNQISPHILVMTATPIPRTLAMTTYGDLDESIIAELPPGRKVIRTVHRLDGQRSEVMHFIREEIAKGRQAYIVYPLIEESEKLDYENLERGYEVVKQYFPDHRYNVAIVHGRQNSIEREHNMSGFVKGEAQVLVATTVIEVGVDVPNANVMLIESAERFGLAQLHQLRGRVGRGAEQSYCILMTGHSLNPEAKMRIQTMVKEHSGFAVSEKDLELRGPGEITGTRQSGMIQFKIADLGADRNILELARQDVLKLLEADPDLHLPEHAKLERAFQQYAQKNGWGRIS